MTDPPASASLVRLRGFARLWDDAIRLPVIGGVGLDALVGLVPGVGDVVGGLLSGYALVVAASLGAPAPVLARMLLNIGIDTAVGLIPLVGDLFDASWKANRRNVQLLERWLDDPHGARRASRLVLAATALAFVALLVLIVWGAVLTIAWLLQQVHWPLFAQA